MGLQTLTWNLPLPLSSCITCLTSPSSRIRSTVILWFMISNTRICSLPCFWHWAPKTPGISKVIAIKVSFIVLMWWLLGDTKVGGLLPGVSTMWLDGWSFSLYLHPLHHWEGRDWRLSLIASRLWFHQACLWNEASINTQKDRAFLDWWTLGGPWSSLSFPPISRPVDLFYLAVPELHPLTVNQESRKRIVAGSSVGV